MNEDDGIHPIQMLHGYARGEVASLRSALKQRDAAAEHLHTTIAGLRERATPLETELQWAQGAAACVKQQPTHPPTQAGQRAQLQSLLQDVLLRLEDINNELDTNDMHVGELRLKVSDLQRRAQAASQAAGAARDMRTRALHVLAHATPASRATTVFSNPLAEECSPPQACRSALERLRDLHATL